MDKTESGIVSAGRWTETLTWGQVILPAHWLKSVFSKENYFRLLTKSNFQRLEEEGGFRRFIRMCSKLYTHCFIDIRVWSCPMHFAGEMFTQKSVPPSATWPLAENVLARALLTVVLDFPDLTNSINIKPFCERQKIMTNSTKHVRTFWVHKKQSIACITKQFTK